MPRKNSGIETPKPDIALARRSEKERLRNAETIPKGTDQASPRISAMLPSSMVAGHRAPMSVVTGLRVRQLSPRSPDSSCWM